MKKKFRVGLCVLFTLTGIFSGSAYTYASTETLSTQKNLPEPHWKVSDFPDVAINQDYYEDINLNNYIILNKNDRVRFSLTSGKSNPDWITLTKQGLLHFIPEKISPEDVDTTQVIYLTATSLISSKSSPMEVGIKVVSNKELPPPTWQNNFVLKDAVPNQPYFINLAPAVNMVQLQDKDQLTFQLVDSSVDWLEIGDNGFSLIAKQVPVEAAGKYYEVALRVTSKMSGKSSEFNGKIFVNLIPEAPQWQALPAATLNQNYYVDINSLIRSNIRNDLFDFDVDVSHLPRWLSITNNHIIRGVPREPRLIGEPQKITVTAKSKVTGIRSQTTLIIPVHQNPNLAPQLKQNFFNNLIIDEVYRSPDLTQLLDKRYPYDEFSFQYLEGPRWLTYNPACHCITGHNKTPRNQIGKTVIIKLRIRSAASGQTLDYSQPLKIYNGIPRWTRTELPEVKIAQEGIIELPINDYTQNDISGDEFDYKLDHSHAPAWMSLTKKASQTLLIIDPKAISPQEVSTSVAVRLLATSQRTQKTSVQLLTIHVGANSDLPAPEWLHAPNPVATVGVAHAIDLSQYIKPSIDSDQLTIQSAVSDLHWISLSHNRLMGIPPKDQIGGPFPIILKVHSQARGTDTLLKMNMNVQLALLHGQNMETHEFKGNYQSIVIRGLQKNHRYRLFEVKGSNLDYGPFYSPYAIKTEEDWNNNPFYAVNHDRMIKTGADGIISLVYYSRVNNPPPQIELVLLR